MQQMSSAAIPQIVGGRGAGLGRPVEGLSSRLRRRVRVTRLYTHDLQSIPDVPFQPGDSIEVLERSRSRILLDIYPVDLSEDLSRLEQRHQCFVGWSHGRAAHFSWVQDTGVHEIRGTWRRDAIQPGDFWIYSCRTADWARGRRLYPAALATILNTYKKLNRQRALICVAEENGPSINGIERAGFVLTERIRSFALRASLFRLPGSSYLGRAAVTIARRDVYRGPNAHAE
jgi:hypothetical protein